MSAPMASATGGQEGTGLLGLLSARRTEDQERLRRLLYARDLLSSLWAPVTALALLLIPYLLLVELFPSTGHWAAPAMRGLGLLSFLWFAGLLAFRLVARQPARLRRLRHEAREATADVDAALRARGAKIDTRARERLVEMAARVDASMLGGDAEALEKHLRALVDAGSALPGKSRNETADLVVGLAKALAVALLIRTVLVEPFKIPSGSMIPTLEIGDQIFVNKFIYGVRIPFLNIVPFALVREPERGDVIVFNNPADTSKDFIKRVVGIPGDVVDIRDDVVFINGREQPRTLKSEDFPAWKEEPSRADWWLLGLFEDDWRMELDQLYEENLSGHLHPTLQRPLQPRSMENGPFRVPDKAVFVMGDNRDDSADSRVGFGGRERPAYVPYGNIKGKAMIVWLSLGHGGLFSRLFGGTGIRTDRFFHPVR
ncbi:MAG: signal peptidase I [Myxococcaceae bacterium]